MHVYHYAGNNPVKYVDPDGSQNVPGIFGTQDYWSSLAEMGEPFSVLLNLFNRADNGDQAASYMLQYTFHQAGRDALEKINEGSSTAALVFFAVGFVEAAGVASAVSTITSAALSVDDILSGNIAEGVIGIAGVVAGTIASTAISKGVEKAIDNGIAVTVGKNNQFYSLGHRGAIKAWDAIERKIKGDIASGIYGRLAPEAANQIINSAKDAYKAIVKKVDEEN
jgi:hypothetical protein